MVRQASLIVSCFALVSLPCSRRARACPPGAAPGATGGKLRELSDAAARSCGIGVAAEASAHAGVVIGSGENDLEAARAAFERAGALDPRVRLDERMAPPAVLEVFEEVQIRAERCEIAFVRL